LVRPRRTASSLTILRIPSKGGLTGSQRSAVTCAYRRWPDSTDNITVPSRSRFFGAFGLLNDSGQSATHASNSPACFK